MKMMFKLFTLGLGTCIAISVSLSCSFWFFYSLLGSTGPQAVMAGIAGCALQLFGYGFAASFVNLNTLQRILLSLMPLALSMFASYSTLYGHLSEKQESVGAQKMEQEVMVGILNQSVENQKLASQAAKQSLDDRYRTQAKAFIELNQSAIQKDREMLDRLESKRTSNLGTTPLDGLVRITGDSELTMVAFCAWLSLMLELLPVISIAIWSKASQPSVAATARLAESPNVGPQIEDSEPKDVRPGGQIETEVPEMGPLISDHQELALDPVSKASSDASRPDDERNISLDQIAELLITNKLEPNYKAMRDLTGWSQWESQEAFKTLKAKGVVEKVGRSFRVVVKPDRTKLKVVS